MKIFIVFILLIQSEGAIAQYKNANCTAFKTGIFNYRDTASNMVRVIRTNKQQTEINNQTGVKTKLKIRWIDDCTYRLTQVWSSDKAARKNKRSATDVKITNVYNDRYDYSCACKDSAYSKKYGGTMIIVKD